ncbi:MAG: alpha/beta fold hydrolase [Streptosporangiaceae bacterium]
MGGRMLRRIEAGTGRPDVLLEAGRNDVAASWRPVMDLLSPQLHVVAYDRAGLGASPPAADPAILARQVDDLTTIITAAAAGRCVLAGHSWGGILVQLLAVRRPDLVAGLVLVDPAHEQMTEALPQVARWGTRLARLGRPDELRGGDTAASLGLLRELRRTSPPFPDVPVVVLSASRGFPRRFRAHWTELQADLAASAPRGRHIVVHRAGHQIHRQRPDVVAGAIRQVAAEARGGLPAARRAVPGLLANVTGPGHLRL